MGVDGAASAAVRLVVSGRVHGVGYRAWLVAAARRRGLDGWARNRADGTVEALVHGDPALVRELTALCREGPPAARVATVHCAAEASVPEAGFRLLPTV